MPTYIPPVGFAQRKHHAAFGPFNEIEAILLGIYRPISEPVTAANAPIPDTTPPSPSIPFQVRHPPSWFTAQQAALGPATWAFLVQVLAVNHPSLTQAPDPNPPYSAALPVPYPPAGTLKVAVPSPDGIGFNGTGWMWAP